MNFLIIEDEPLAAKQLQDIIRECYAGAVFLRVIDSVEEAVAALQSNTGIDVVFMDIHLSDGRAFEIFNEVETDLPIIFTTAYDQYAIRAFDVNSVDYLLKPIQKEKVKKALTKLQKQTTSLKIKPEDIKQLQKLMVETRLYKENFLVSFKEKLIPVPVSDFAWFEIKNAVVIGARFDKTAVVLEDRSLDELAIMVDPRQFYRANRQYLINKRAVKEIVHYFNGKLKAAMHPSPSEPVIISREKATAFKHWIIGQ